MKTVGFYGAQRSLVRDKIVLNNDWSESVTHHILGDGIYFCIEDDYEKAKICIKKFFAYSKSYLEAWAFLSATLSISDDKILNLNDDDTAKKLSKAINKCIDEGSNKSPEEVAFLIITKWFKSDRIAVVEGAMRKENFHARCVCLCSDTYILKNTVKRMEETS